MQNKELSATIVGNNTNLHCKQLIVTKLIQKQWESLDKMGNFYVNRIA